jgi:hypothetical protein
MQFKASSGITIVSGQAGLMAFDGALHYPSGFHASLPYYLLEILCLRSVYGTIKSINCCNFFHC